MSVRRVHIDRVVVRGIALNRTALAAALPGAIASALADSDHQPLSPGGSVGDDPVAAIAAAVAQRVRSGRSGRSEGANT